METQKERVRDFWEADACGESLYLENSTTREGFFNQAAVRYELEPYIQGFAEFEKYRGKRVLEVGIGLGADHQRFAESGVELVGLDLTRRSVGLVERRFEIMGLKSRLLVGDAENLAFPGEAFDLVYSWGVIHHTPDTARAAREILRVLKPGGEFKVMIYHKWSVVGCLLWLRYALLRFRPFTPLKAIYDQFLESPGTKAFSVKDAEGLFRGAAHVEARPVLTHGDLLSSGVGQRHKGAILCLARKLWPRSFVRRVFKKHGLYLLIRGQKA